ncbi:dihydroxyacetone kinase family protein [Streptomyces inusitatus]|uniref:Dihydroxyacetone kinase family protein n=1 Tax=Streptomyces inusitatus TaxID=68221 RepID=A0A918Q456_9ACTN|nr:dihydroxyacetone kinase subunit DhaK [Streptomyces inusitatus]GGZ32621.1 dihydroxyacetone kinase family protein [Streptomyces inusitatus]
MSFFLPGHEAVLLGCRGLALSHPGIGVCPDPLYLLATRPSPGRRVALVAGGGAGHEPLDAGLLGRGGLDAVVPGPVFTSPTGAQVEAGARAAAALGARDGVLLIVKNYTGDRINFALAAERVRAAGIEVAEVVVDDDLATAGTAAGRRGTAGVLVVEKMLGAMADRGAGLAALAELGSRVAAATRSLAVCARAHTSPSLGLPAFPLPPGALDYGVGIHGERAARTVAASGPVEHTVGRMLDELLAALPDGLPTTLPTGLPDGPSRPRADDGVIAVISGLGGTGELELRAISALVHRELTARGTPVRSLAAGVYATALDMAGFSITLTRTAPGWLELWTSPTDTPLRLPGPAGGGTALTPPRLSDGVPRRASLRNAPRAEGAFLRELHRLVLAAHADLTALDQAAGDGDFGDNFRGGVAEAARHARESGLAGTAALADTFRDRVGGSSGPLFGLLFTAMAPVADRVPADVRRLAAALQQALTRISAVGGAVPGDRTLLDALAPAARSLTAAPPEDRHRAVTAAARAAIDGALATAALPARLGRASYTGAHGTGRPDPGAVAVALVLIALARVHEPGPAARLPDPARITHAGVLG